MLRLAARAGRESFEQVAKHGDLFRTEPEPEKPVEERSSRRSASKVVVEDTIEARAIFCPLDHDRCERFRERPAVLETDGAHGSKRVESFGGRGPEAATTQSPEQLVE